MPKLSCSLTAILLMGAVTWAQQPGLGSFGGSAATDSSRQAPVSADAPAQLPNNGDSVIPATAPRADELLPLGRSIQDENGTTTLPAEEEVKPSVRSVSGVGFSSPPSMRSYPVAPMRAKQVQRTIVETQMIPLTDAELADQRRYQEVVSILRSDKPEPEKEGARQQLQKLLALGFDRDLESREGELKALEARVQRLRVQLEKRKAAKSEIIELRVKTIQNEADGLEYPEGVSGAVVSPTEVPPSRPRAYSLPRQPLPDPNSSGIEFYGAPSQFNPMKK